MAQLEGTHRGTEVDREARRVYKTRLYSGVLSWHNKRRVRKKTNSLPLLLTWNFQDHTPIGRIQIWRRCCWLFGSAIPVEATLRVA
jgi:hypothetical protein